MRVETPQLAEFIFKNNTSKKLINIEVDGIKDTKDMFMFCVELLYHGIGIMCGGPPINLDDMSHADFAKIKEHLVLAGIEVNVDVTLHGSIKEDNSVKQPSSGLEKHHMILTTSKATYDVWFKLVHNVGSG